MIGYLNLEKSKNQTNIHILPCTFSQSVPTDASKFENEKVGSEYEAYLRGHQLSGVDVPLGGYLLEKTGDDWKTQGIFETIRYWEHDETPHPKSDPFLQLPELIRFQNLLREP